MPQAFTYTEELVIEHCWCGMPHAIPRNLQRRAHDEGAEVYCPLGHVWVVKETEAAKLRRKLVDEQTNVSFWREKTRAAERSKTALKGQLTKARKRAVAGVCPCCQRSFVQLARHMKSQHPNFDPAE